MMKIAPLSLAALSLACCAMVGCGSGQDRNAATSKTTAAVPIDATKARQDLNQVVLALKNVRESADGAAMKPLFGELKSRAGGLSGSLSELASSSETAISTGKEQIEGWREQSNAFTDADLRNASNAREANLRTAVDELVVSRGTFMTSSADFSSALDQVIIALDLDPSQNGVTSIKPVLTKLIDGEPDLGAAIKDVADKCRAVHGAVNP